jgi:pyruvate/2-oxoglutarate dehydrogenase complex dihydrolipoamide acyltransferase (E2) component
MKETPAGYRSIPFPVERRLELDAAWIQRRKATIWALVEVDVTAARQKLRAYKRSSGHSLSFTAFLVSCLARALDDHKNVQAYRSWRDRLIIFEDVDVAVLIEIPWQGRHLPLLHVVRAANRKSVYEIHREVRAVQADPALSPHFNPQAQRLMRGFLRLPGFLRRLVYRFLLGNPHWFRQVAGTVAVTAVGMFGKGAGWGINISSHSLTLTVGGIAQKPATVGAVAAIRECLSLTIGFDHVITDGAPAARFVQRLRELIERGHALPNTEPPGLCYSDVSSPLPGMR